MLFNATQAEELRVAIVDGQKLLDLDIEIIGNEQRKGNIYKGTITRIEPSLDACFVDYGTDRHGFLPFKEVSRSYFRNYESGRAKIQDVLQEGMSVLVQVEKDERGNKGAALTTFISLAGRYLVLMPNNPRAGGVSRRIVGDERQELKDVMNQLEVPQGMSIIARTAGIGRSVEEMQWDLSYLISLWQAVSNAASTENIQPLILQESSLVIRAIRDYFQPDIGEILIDNDEVFQKVYQFVSLVMPNNLSCVKRYNGDMPLFSRFQIEHQIETAFSREVPLPSGGAIVIDHTEALVSIDINSARATKGADVEETATKTNLEAAEEIARQMRLRDLGGLIVIDFIDMENPKNQRQVEQVLREALKQDRARVQMQKLSRFGLMELSRQRLQLSLGESTHITCPRCYGTGVIRGTESSALHILRMIQEEAMKENTGEVKAQVPVDVATFLLNEKRAELFNLEDRLGVPIVLIPNIYLETPHYTVERIRFDDIDEKSVPSYKQVEEIKEEDTTRAITDKNRKVVQEAAVQGITHNKPAPVAPSSSLFNRLGQWFKGLFIDEEVPPAKQVHNKKNANQVRKNRKPQNRRVRVHNNAVANELKQNVNGNKNDNKQNITNKTVAKEKPVANSTKSEPLTSNEKKSAEVLVAAANNTESVQRNKQRRFPQNDSAKKDNAESNGKNNARNFEKKSPKNLPQVPVEQEPLVINIGALIVPENKKTSNRKQGSTKRIRDAQEIIDKIKYRAIVRNVQYVSKRIAGDLLPVQEQSIVADAVISVVPTMMNDNLKEPAQELPQNLAVDEQTENYSESLSDESLSVSELELQQTIESIGAMIQEMVASGSLEQQHDFSEQYEQNTDSDDGFDEAQVDEHQNDNGDLDSLQSNDNGGLQLIETNKQSVSDVDVVNENVSTVSKRRSDMCVADKGDEEKTVELQQVETKSE